MTENQPIVGTSSLPEVDKPVELNDIALFIRNIE